MNCLSEQSSFSTVYPFSHYNSIGDVYTTATDDDVYMDLDHATYESRYETPGPLVIDFHHNYRDQASE